MSARLPTWAPSLPRPLLIPNLGWALAGAHAPLPAIIARVTPVTVGSLEVNPRLSLMAHEVPLGGRFIWGCD